jgi:hypothetical protein
MAATKPALAAASERTCGDADGVCQGIEAESTESLGLLQTQAKPSDVKKTRPGTNMSTNGSANATWEISDIWTNQTKCCPSKAYGAETIDACAEATGYMLSMINLGTVCTAMTMGGYNTIQHDLQVCTCAGEGYTNPLSMDNLEQQMTGAMTMLPEEMTGQVQGWIETVKSYLGDSLKLYQH